MSGIHSGKVVVVTGSSGGIGLLIAKYLSNEGANVVLADINPDSTKIAKELSTPGLGICCDVTEENSMISMANATVEKFGKIDVLINNAGIFPVNAFSKVSLEEWKRVIDIDLTGTFIASHAVWGIMEKQKRGKIINMASISGRVGGMGFTHYSAAKAGVIGFTKALAREGARMGIQVNAIAPGVIATDTAKNNFPKYALDEHVRTTPAGRLGSPEDLMGIVSFLCSESSNYVIGQVIAVDGGYTMI